MSLSDQAIAETFCYSEGDLVSFLGDKGRIVSIGHDTQMGWKYPLKVIFDSGRVGYFTSSGKCWEEQTEPALKIVELTRPKVKRWRWVYRDTLDNEVRLSEGTYTEYEAQELFSDLLTCIKETEEVSDE